MAAPSENPVMRALAGRSVGRYELLEPLGRGGMGTVFKARQARLEKLVAVKVLDPARASRDGAMTRFWREARAAAQIRHPNVVEVFDVGVEDGVAFLAMELLDGQDLAAYLKSRRPLELSEAVEVLVPVLAGVRAAHEAGVIHRDLKPSNIFLARRGRTLVSPVVLDFGVSRLLDDEELGPATATSGDALIGTAAYVAPEQAKRARLADDRSDQYALGVILYECVTGQRPFSGESTYELLHAIATAPVRRPSELNPALPATFDELLLRALARDPDGRFVDIDEFASALLSFATPRTWMLWGRELLADKAEDEAISLATAPSTEPRPSASPSVRRQATSRLRVPLAFALGALCSAGSLALVRFAFRAESREAPPTAASQAPVAATSADERSSSPQAPVSETAPSESAVSRAAPRLPAASALDVPARAAPSAKSKAPRAARRDGGSPTMTVELGANDAPILN